MVCRQNRDVPPALRATGSMQNQQTPDATPSFMAQFGRNYGTPVHWMDYAIGNDKNWAPATRPGFGIGNIAVDPGFSIAYWMPTDFTGLCSMGADDGKACDPTV